MNFNKFIEEFKPIIVDRNKHRIGKYLITEMNNDHMNFLDELNIFYIWSVMKDKEGIAILPTTNPRNKEDRIGYIATIVPKRLDIGKIEYLDDSSFARICVHCKEKEGNYVENPYVKEISNKSSYDYICNECYKNMLEDI